MVRLVNATLPLVFEVVETEETLFLKEFEQLSLNEEDPVGQWLKLAKARGEASESDPVVLTLLVEMHRKIDALSAYVKNEHVTYLPLAKAGEISKIGFEHFQLDGPILETGKHYYGRIAMPVFPKREFPLFFEALESNLAKIGRIHENDERDWNAYVTARERVMIRQIKAERDGV
jgi:hypothetical protein